MKTKHEHFCYAAFLVICMTLFGCSMLREEFCGGSFWDYANEAKIAAKNQQFDLAAENYRRAFAEAEKYDSPSNLSWSYYYSLSQVYVMQGKNDQALELRKRGLLVSQKMGDDTNGRSTIWIVAMNHCYLGDLYLTQGRYSEALENYKQGMQEADVWSRSETMNSDFTICQIYPSIGQYYIQTGDFEKARQYLQEVLDSAIRRRSLAKDIAIAKNNLAMAYYYAGDDPSAEKLLGGAARLNGNAFVGFPEDIAISLTMLGRIAENRGDSLNALQNYQSARDALHMYSTVTHKVEEADVLNQIGRFQIKQGKPEEAAKAYQEVIGLRQAAGTATHPNCADAYKGLADVAAYKNKLTSATLEATRALAILDKSVMPTHPRCAAELVALASLHALAGHPEQAAPLNARLETILQKPLGPWKEDFLDTASFYAGLLKKAGKTNAAERLDQLRAARAKRP